MLLTKHMNNQIFGISLLILYVLVFSTTPFANAVIVDGTNYEIEELIEDGPLVYDVKITLMDISVVDFANGGYSLSFWVTLTSDDIDFSKIPPPPIDFVNGKVESIEHKYFSHGNSYSQKLYGTFFTSMEFHNYPLMEVSLPIIVEPVKFETHEMKFLTRLPMNRAEYL